MSCSRRSQISGLTLSTSSSFLLPSITAIRARVEAGDAALFDDGGEMNPAFTDHPAEQRRRAG